MKMKQKIVFCGENVKKAQEKLRGSVLAYSLIVLAMMFAIVGSMSVMTILGRNSASSSQSSVQAFQVADGGVQVAIKKINGVLNQTNNKVSDAFSGCTLDASGAAVVKNNTLGTGMEYDLNLFDQNGAAITSCSALASTVGSIKSTGNYQNSVRAVDVALASGSSAGITGGCQDVFVSNSPPTDKITNVWGNGCIAEGTTRTGAGNAWSSVAASQYSCGASSMNGTTLVMLCVHN